MKHIKKKFQNEIPITEEFKTAFVKRETYSAAEFKKLKMVEKDTICMLGTDYGTMINAFPLAIDGRMYFIPEPDPVLIYFNNAYFNFKRIKESRKDLLATLDSVKLLTENINANLYDYFGLCSGFVIFLFTSMEAFMNRLIPDNYVFQVKTKKCTEIYDKENIQSSFNFERKLKEVMKDIKHKEFHKAHDPKYQHIIHLKQFRDNIVHTKTNPDSVPKYDRLFSEAINFKYEHTLLAVRDFMNFYEPGYVEECNCGKDF